MKRFKGTLSTVVVIGIHLMLDSHVPQVAAEFFFDQMGTKIYDKKGTAGIDIAALAGITDCAGNTSENSLGVHFAQIFDFMFEKTDVTIPGKGTIGYIVMDFCDDTRLGVIKSLSFASKFICKGDPNDSSEKIVKAYQPRFAILSGGVQSNKAMSPVMAHSGVLHMGMDATGDALSDQNRFPYYVRMTMADKYLTDAIRQYIDANNWNYVSIAYTHSPAENEIFSAILNPEKLKRKFCMGSVVPMSPNQNDEQTKAAARSLMQNSEAHMVVVISKELRTVEKLIRETVAMGGRFLWLESGIYPDDLEVYGSDSFVELIFGSIAVTCPKTDVSDYESFFMNRTGSETTDPWFGSFLKKFYADKNKKYNANEPVHRATGSDNPNLLYHRSAGQLMDTISMLITVSKRLAVNGCEESDIDCHKRRVCDSVHEGKYTGEIEFDKECGRIGKLVVVQILPFDMAEEKSAKKRFSLRKLAEYDAKNESIKILQDPIWAYKNGTHFLSMPTTNCDPKCVTGEKKVTLKKLCCWTCVKCRKDEIVVKSTKCQACKSHEWPDNATRSSCRPLPIDYEGLSSEDRTKTLPMAVALTVYCSVVAFFFFRNFQCRIIKATSRELSVLMLIGIYMGCVSMFTLSLLADEIVCRVNYILYSSSFTLLFSSVFVRSLRIFRIFEASKKGLRKLRMISSTFQIVMVGGLLMVQLAASCMWMAVKKEWAVGIRRMLNGNPVMSGTCAFPMEAMATFMGYNMLQVAACALMAFHTRNLPDNFNESRFITLCVSTLLVIWITFVPSYARADGSDAKTKLLVIAQAINHAMALSFLYMPKIYAILQGGAQFTGTSFATRISVTEESSVESGTEIAAASQANPDPIQVPPLSAQETLGPSYHTPDSRRGSAVDRKDDSRRSSSDGCLCD